MSDDDLIRRGDALKAAKLASPNAAPMDAIAALPAQGEAMRGALDEIDTEANKGTMIPTYSEGTLRRILKRIRDRDRATLAGKE